MARAAIVLRLLLPPILVAACSDSGGNGAPETGDVGDHADATEPADSGADPDAPTRRDAQEGADIVLDDPADTPDPGDTDGVPDDARDDAGDTGGEPDVRDEAPDGPEPGPGRWEAAAPLAGGARQETAVVAVDGEIYVMGGFNAASAVVPTVEAYNPRTDTWRFRADLPVRLHHANAAVVGGKIWIVGFLTGSGFVPDARIFAYDPAQDTWTAAGRMPEGRDRGASATGVIDGRVFVAGGLRGGAVRDFSAFDPETGQWERLPPLPRNADHIVGGAIDGVFYVAGGRNRSISTHTAQLWAFDPQVGDWEARPPMPTSRAGHAAAVLDAGLYVFGGEGYPDHPSQVHDQAEVWVPAAGAWRTLAPIPTRRHGTGAAALDGRIYLPGGADVIAFHATDAHEVFVP